MVEFNYGISNGEAVMLAWVFYIGISIIFGSTKERTFYVCRFLVAHFFDCGGNNMNTTIITADVDGKTAEFFKVYGEGISNGEVLKRLLLDVSGEYIDGAVELAMWYFDVITSQNAKEDRIEVLYIFTTLCMTLVDDLASVDTDLSSPKKALQGNGQGKTLKLELDNDTLAEFNQCMAKHCLGKAKMLEKAVDDILSIDLKTQPYVIMNYTMCALSALIRPQARMAFFITVNECIDRICKLSGKDKNTVVGNLQNMKEYALNNSEVVKNIDMLKNTAFYKEKI